MHYSNKKLFIYEDSDRLLNSNHLFWHCQIVNKNASGWHVEASLRPWECFAWGMIIKHFLWNKYPRKTKTNIQKIKTEKQPWNIFFLATVCTEYPKGLLQQHHSCCSSLFYSQLKVSCCSVISVMAHDFHQLVNSPSYVNSFSWRILAHHFLCQSHGP